MIKRKGKKIFIQNNPTEQQIRQMMDQALERTPFQGSDEIKNYLIQTLSNTNPLTEDELQGILSAVVEIIAQRLETS